MKMKLLNIILLCGLMHNAYPIVTQVDLLKIKTLWSYFTPKAQCDLLLFFDFVSNKDSIPKAESKATYTIDPILLSVILTEEDFDYYTNDKQKESFITFSEEFKKFAERLEYKFGGSPAQVPPVYPHL